MAYRVDRSVLGQATRTPAGFLRAPATVGRVGIVTYMQPDGSMWRELRPADELFHADSLASLQLALVTNNHPAQSDLPLTTANASRYTVGSVGDSTTRADNELQVMLQVTDPTALMNIDEGRTQISPGYTTELDMTPGEFEGQRYDAIQRKIRYDHIALVDRARGGPSLRLHLDSAGDCTCSCPCAEEPVMENQETPAVVETVEASSAVQLDATVPHPADVMVAELNTKLGAAQAELAIQTARADAAEAALAEAPARIKAAVQARAALENQARAILGDEVKLDAMNDGEIKSAVIAAKLPSMKLDGQSADYVAAAFDIALSVQPAQNAGLLAVRADAETPVAKTASADAAREAMIAKNRSAWKRA